MPIKHIVSVDPGDVNNGFCYFKYDDQTKTADLRIMTIIDGEGMSGLLKTLYELHRDRGPVDENKKNPSGFFFVVENFRMDSHVRGAVFQWNELLTSQMIGRVKLCADWMGAPVFMQEPKILAGATRWGPWPRLPKHIPDDKSAFLHGLHFMTSKNLIRTHDQVTMFGQERM